jgi:dienelactone hydrolase
MRSGEKLPVLHPATVQILFADLQIPRGGLPPVELVTYPGAHHDFNNPDLQPGRKIFDHWVEYNAEAAEDANRRIREFLTR